MSEEYKRLWAERFAANAHRHRGVAWEAVEAALEREPGLLSAYTWMEESGGEPDVIRPAEDGGWYVADCSRESPVGRRSLCYDREAWEKRRANKPQGDACSLAESRGLELLDEEAYRELQAVAGPLDTKSSSWLSTPLSMRQQGGALFGDARYGRVFCYHNGAESYYAARGFRVRVFPGDMEKMDTE